MAVSDNPLGQIHLQLVLMNMHLNEITGLDLTVDDLESVGFDETPETQIDTQTVQASLGVRFLIKTG